MAKASGVIRKGTAEVPAQGESNFVKIAKGSSVILAPTTGLDEMLSIQQHAFWLEGGNSPVFACIGDGCPGCAAGNKARFRGFLQVKTPEGESKIWSFPISIERKLQELEEASGSIKGVALKIKATAKGQFTDFAVLPLGKKIKVDDVEALDIVSAIGPTSRKEILAMMADAGIAPRKKATDDEEEEDDIETAEAEAGTAAAKKKAPVKKAPVIKVPTKSSEETEDEATEEVEDEWS